MNPALAGSYLTVTEQPGQPASRVQLEMLEARYAWAAAQAREKDVLEAGCGAGIGLPVLGRVARSVQAGDVDRDNLRAARAACRYANTDVRAFSAEELPFPNESFDLVLLFEAIYYLADVRRFLDEARRVLRPGGRLLIVSVNPEWDGFNPSPHQTRYWRAAELSAVLEKAGFAAQVQGAFPETTGGITRWIRRAAVALQLIPRTMRGKALLKRVFYGPLQVLPPQAGSGSLPPALKEWDASESHRYRVLYATACKEGV